MSWARAPKHTHAKWQAKKNIYTREKKVSRERVRERICNEKGIITRQDTFRAIMKTANTHTLNKIAVKMHRVIVEKKFMRNATEGLCSAATYYLLKGVCDETDRFNSHHVVSHAYNYPLSIHYAICLVRVSVCMWMLRFERIFSLLSAFDFLCNCCCTHFFYTYININIQFWNICDSSGLVVSCLVVQILQSADRKMNI